MNPIKLILLFSITMFTNLLLAQSSEICGRISDTDTKEAVQFASVALYENGVLKTGVDSDLDGNYCISNVADGVYDMEVNRHGYFYQKIKDLNIKTDVIINVDFRIKETSKTGSDQIYHKALFKNNSYNNKTYLSGRLTDKATKEPILFANIAIYTEGLLTAAVETDIDGNYYFANIKSGKYNIEASYPGYKTTTLKDVVVYRGEHNIVDLVLNDKDYNEVKIYEYKEPLIKPDHKIERSHRNNLYEHQFRGNLIPEHEKDSLNYKNE